MSTDNRPSLEPIAAAAAHASGDPFAMVLTWNPTSGDYRLALCATSPAFADALPGLLQDVVRDLATRKPTPSGVIVRPSREH